MSIPRGRSSIPQLCCPGVMDVKKKTKKKGNGVEDDWWTTTWVAIEEKECTKGFEFARVSNKGDQAVSTRTRAHVDTSRKTKKNVPYGCVLK